jgi:hypothetical protein
MASVCLFWYKKNKYKPCFITLDILHFEREETRSVLFAVNVKNDGLSTLQTVVTNPNNPNEGEKETNRKATKKKRKRKQ